MTCQNCGASVRLDHELGVMICDYCGSQFTPPADEDGVQVTGETTHPCPLCHTPLSTGRIEARDLLYCTACHGMLVHMDDLMPLIEGLRAHRDRSVALLTPRPGTDASRDLHCPLCNGAMDNHAYGGGGNVMVDSCEECSQVWLDRGELRKIVIAPDPEPVYSNYGTSGQPDRDER
jgi:Zn-finger nucleic acid-binding protein